ncbi:hypothetical protein BGZ54_000224, partial [Gamsiella multidivaricata]
MVDTTQSPLAMLVLITPYTILYFFNQLFLHGILDKVHYLFFELIFVLAFRKVFGLPDLTDRLFPSHPQLSGPINIQSVEGLQPVKTTLASPAVIATAAAATTTTTVATTETRTVVDATAVRSTTPHEGVVSTVQGADLTVKKLAIQAPTTTLAVSKTKGKEDGPFAKELAAMEKKFMDYIDHTEIWEKVYEDNSVKASNNTNDSTGWIQVFQYKSRPMCYKIIAYMNNTPAVTFDTLCDLSRRSEWDPMCVEARVLEEVAPGTTVQYVRTKAVWPTASRDTVVLGTIKDLGTKG